MSEYKRTILAVAVLALACSDRQVSNDETPLEPLCLFAAGTMGYWQDGHQTRVANERGSTPSVCTCITKEQYFDEAEIERLTDELNDELLLECERGAALQDFDWDDCQNDHDTDEWNFALLGIDEFWTPFSCGGEGWAFGNDVPP